MKNKIVLALFALSLLSASCNPFARPSLAGVVKTINGGADWQLANIIKNTKNGTINAANISTMAFDPTRRETVYAGSYNEGLYKSEDAAATWTRILSKIQVYDFAINPNDTKNVFAAGYYGGFGKVLITKDGGATWTEIYNEQSTDNPVRVIALNPANPTQILIGTAGGNVVRSDDQGTSWRVVKELNDRIQRIAWTNSTIYVLTRDNGLFKAQDNSSQFDNITNNLAGVSQDYFLNNRTIRYFNQLFIDPSGVLYVTGDSGLYRSTDGGNTWTQLVLPVQKTADQVRAIAVARSSSNIIYTSIGSTIYKSVDGGVNWQTQKLPTTSLVYYILIDPNLPQITYAGLYAP